MKNNIILIGMPGAGKSTVGVVLAKTLGYDFIDTDILMCKRIGTTLQAYIDQHGIDAFLNEEEKTAFSIECGNTVIATGGSMVFSDAAMRRLKDGSVTIFFDIPLPELKKRLENIRTRGIAAAAGQTIEDIYRQRLPLYRNYADITLPKKSAAQAEQTGGELPDLEGLVQEILGALQQCREGPRP
jgi:shikimate kinase